MSELKKYVLELVRAAKSRKFQLTVVFFYSVFQNYRQNWGVPREAIHIVSMVLIVYVITEGIRDIKEVENSQIV
jgi:Na+/alanine symporter